jgi:hypothetical protein
MARRSATVTADPIALWRSAGDEIQLMKLVEDRLRPSIQIDQQAVETYYHDQLLPEMKKPAGPAKPLTEVFARIKDLLAEKKMNELLSGWLASLRSGSHIRLPIPAPESRTVDRRNGRQSARSQSNGPSNRLMLFLLCAGAFCGISFWRSAFSP